MTTNLFSVPVYILLLLASQLSGSFASSSSSSSSEESSSGEEYDQYHHDVKIDLAKPHEIDPHQEHHGVPSGPDSAVEPHVGQPQDVQAGFIRVEPLLESAQPQLVGKYFYPLEIPSQGAAPALIYPVGADVPPVFAYLTTGLDKKPESLNDPDGEVHGDSPLNSIVLKNDFAAPNKAKDQLQTKLSLFRDANELESERIADEKNPRNDPLRYNQPPLARAIMMFGNNIIGAFYFFQRTPFSSLDITGTVVTTQTNLRVEIHGNGDVTNNCAQVGRIYNPTGVQDGGIIAKRISFANGVASSFYVNDRSLFQMTLYGDTSIIGKSVVVYDMNANPIAPIACGVIQTTNSLL